MQLGYESEASIVAARLSRLLSRPDQQFFVAECDGAVVGWLHAVVSDSFVKSLDADGKENLNRFIPRVDE